jgi:PEP-CTERM motif
MKKVLLAACAAFAFIATAYTQTVLTETFTYANGSSLAGQGPWTTRSGTAGQQDIVSGQLHLDDADSEDTVATLTTPGSSGTIQASFNFTMPSADIVSSSGGAYILNFVSTASGTTGDIARFYVATNGFSSPNYSIGVSTGAAAPVFFAVSFTLDVTYLMFLSYDFGTDTASLFETAHGSISATDTLDTANIFRFGFRQGDSAQGDALIDNLTVQLFPAVPEPATSVLIGLGLLLATQRLFRRRSR